MTDDEDVLVCEFERRPKAAPSIFDVAPAVRRVSREPGAVVVDFDSTAADAVAAYAAAERLCCPRIRWDLAPAPHPRLRISTTPGRLQTIVEMFESAGARAP